MADLPDNGAITANGTYYKKVPAGRRVVIGVSGGFGAGTLTGFHVLPDATADGENVAITNQHVDAAPAFSFTASGVFPEFVAPSGRLAFVLAGATTPTLVVTVTLAAR